MTKNPVKFMNENILIKNRGGKPEPLDLDKIHRMLELCSYGLNISISDVALNAHLKIADNMSTIDIQQTLIKSASEKITPEHPDYSILAGRLMVTNMRKEVYGQFNPTPFLEYINKNVKSGLYSPDILDKYSSDEIKELGKYIDYENDMNRGLSSITQMESKYLIKDVKTNKSVEMIQETFMIIPMVIFADDDHRMDLIKDFYDALKNDEVSLPTPIISGVRTQLKMFSSCCKIKMGDTTESILSTEYALSLMTAQRAGIGVDMGPVRGILAPVKNNTVKHTGALPLLKNIESASKQFTQNSLRTGATVVNYPVFNYEIMDVLEYKNNQGSNTTRARFIDYSIGVPDLFVQRVLSKSDWTLFSAEEVPELFENYGDGDKFKEVYEKYEARNDIRKTTVPAIDVFNKLIKERVGTGRIYIHFVDNVNKQGMFSEKVTQTNLCLVGDTLVDVLINGDKKKMAICDIVNSSEAIKVLSYKTKTGRTTYEKVTDGALMEKNAELYEVEDELGNKVKCTGDHLFWTENRGYIKAKNLKEDDILLNNKFSVYKITNLKNDKSYIGYSRHKIEHRFHIHQTNANNGKDTHLYRAFRKNGIESFCITLISEHSTEVDAQNREIKEIAKCGYYNETDGGSGGWCVPKDKFSEWMTKLKQNTYGKNNPRYSGYTDGELLCIARKEVLDKKGFIKINELYKKYKNYPKNFSKNRFVGYDGNSGYVRFRNAYKDMFSETFPIYIKTDEHCKKLRAATMKYNEGG